MIIKSYYVDSCIYLNLWKEEGDNSKGTPYWRIAKDFFENISLSVDKEVIYSGVVLKELKFNLDKDLFEKKVLLLKKDMSFRLINTSEKDRLLARQLESKFDYEISFYDCVHIAICKRLNAILVTRDKKLIKFARRFIRVLRPEELFT